MNILVTGGAGFIGSHLVDELINKKNKVAVIDNLSTGRKDNLSKQVDFFKIDIVDKKNIEKIFNKFKPDVVYHLAAQKDVRYSVKNPDIDAQINILGSLNLIKLSLKYQIKKFIFVSSGGAIYDENENLPFTENSKVKPLSPYGLAKYTIDQYLEIFQNTNNFPFVSLRLANVYGPRQDPLGEAGVVAIFFNTLKNNKQPHLNGGGKQTRDFVYVKDVVNALWQVSQFPVFGIYNIGTGIPTSIAELLKLQQSLCGTNIEAIFSPAQPGEVMRNALSYQKAKKDFFWQPQYDLTKGLIETVNWFKN